jgi:hypothetical protein
MREAIARRTAVQGRPWGKNARSYLKSSENKSGLEAQVAKGLPSKCGALSSNPSTTKKNSKSLMGSPAVY